MSLPCSYLVQDLRTITNAVFPSPTASLLCTGTCASAGQSGFSFTSTNLSSSYELEQDSTRTLQNFLRTAYENSVPNTNIKQSSIRQLNIHSHIQCKSRLYTFFFFSSLCNNSFFFHSFSFSSSFSLLMAEISISSLATSSWWARHWRTWNK